MKKTLVSFVLLAFVGAVHAWGAREQGALAGVAGVLAFQHILKGSGVGVSPPPHYSISVEAPPPAVMFHHRTEPVIIYQAPPPPLPASPYCMYHPYHLPDGRLLGYSKSCH